MSHPDPRQPAEANGAYPYGQPVHDSAITTGTGMPDADTRQYEEWHHADPPPRGAGGWDTMQEFGPPPDWADEGVFIAGDDDRQPEWDTGPASPIPPYRTPRHQPARRLTARRIATTALVLLCITAITFVMFPRNHTIRISPADNPAATASQPTQGVQGGSTPISRARGSRADQGRRRAHPGQLLAGEQHGQRVTVRHPAEDSRGRQQLQHGRRHIPDGPGDRSIQQPVHRVHGGERDVLHPASPAGVYPQWFVARITYANLAAPQHATGAGYVLFTESAKNAPWKNVLEPYLLPGSGPGPFV